MNTTELIAQVRADIAARKTMPDFGPETSIERIKTINATQRSFTPETVEALVEALESAQINNELTRGRVLIAHRTILNQQARIAELEARTVTVKLPESVIDAICHSAAEIHNRGNGVTDEKAQEIINSIRCAAGITCEVKGE